MGLNSHGGFSIFRLDVKRAEKVNSQMHVNLDFASLCKHEFGRK